MPGSFAELLRGYRQAAHLSQEELAERSGLSVQAISMLERKARVAPRPSTVEHLANALSLDADARAALVAAARPPLAASEVAPAPDDRPDADTPAGGPNVPGQRFAELLRAHRASCRLTQDELAAAAAMSVRAVRDLESGATSQPRRASVARLALALALTGPERAAMQVAAGGPGDMSPTPAELPRPLADHVGRDDVLCDLVAVLAGTGRGGRIAAIGGMGGIGKTTLAVRVAGSVAGHFPDGVIYIDLKGADTAALSPATVLTFLLRTLGVRESDIPADPDRRGALLRTTTATRRQLFVFDNVRDAAQVRPLLPGSVDCGVLVTSRDRLAGLDGAHHVTLHPFDEQDSRALLSAMVDGGRLDAEPDAVSDLIARCAGHPLALRIAGCRLAARPTHSIRSLVDRLVRTPTPLADLSVGDLAVRTVLESSFHRLLDDEQAAARAFRLWGVWPGGDISLPAVCALLDRSRRDTERALDHLLDGHLLESPHIDAYRMHDLLRSYAQERAGSDLPEAERSAVLARVVGWYLYAADRAVTMFAPYARRLPFEDVPEPPELPEFSTPADALEWCDVERTNLLAIVHRAADAGVDPAGGAGFDRMAWLLGTSLLPYFEQRMLWPEWVDSHLVARAGAQRIGDEVGEARATNGLAAAYRRANEPERAIAVAQEALVLLRRLGDHERAAAAMDTIARAQHDLGRLAEAMATFAAIGDDERYSAFRRATSLCHLGMMKREAGATDAIEVLGSALRIAREGAQPHAEIPILQALGRAYADRGDYAAATGTLTECLERSRAVSDRIHESEALRYLGQVAVATGDRSTGRHHLTAALDLMTALSHPDEPVVRRALAALHDDLPTAGPV